MVFVKGDGVRLLKAIGLGVATSAAIFALTVVVLWGAQTHAVELGVMLVAVAAIVTAITYYDGGS